MKVYLASSWKNATEVRQMASFLRESKYEVDAFCDESTGRYVFSWTEIVFDKDDLDAISFLEDHRAQNAFEEDKRWLDWADAVLLMLPCGRSAHLEAGYCAGQGKRLVIYSEDGFPQGEFDVMYGFASDLVTDLSSVLKALGD